MKKEKRPYAQLEGKASEVFQPQEETLHSSSDRSFVNTFKEKEPRKVTSQKEIEQGDKTKGKIFKVLFQGWRKTFDNAVRVAGYGLVFIVGSVLVFLWADKTERRVTVTRPQVEGMSTAIEKQISVFEESLNTKLKDFETVREQLTLRVNALTEEIHFLKEGQKNLENLQRNPSQDLKDNPEFSKLSNRLDQVEQQLSQHLASVNIDGTTDNLSDLSLLKQKVQTLETLLSSSKIPLNIEPLQEVQSTSNNPSSVAVPNLLDWNKLLEEIAAFKTWKETTEKLISLQKEVVAKLSQDLEDIQKNEDKKKTNYLGISDQAAQIAPLTSQMTEVQHQLANLKSSLRDQESYLKSLQIFFSFFDLKKAVEAGRSFSSELETFRKASEGKFDLKAFEPYQNEGVPTNPEIKKISLSVFPLMKPLSESPPHSTLWERILEKGKTVVRIRKLETSASGEADWETEHRLEKAVAEDRWDNAVREADKLSPDLKVQISAWYTKVFSRVTVDRTLSDLEKDLKGNLVSQSIPHTLNSGP